MYHQHHEHQQIQRHPQQQQPQQPQQSQQQCPNRRGNGYAPGSDGSNGGPTAAAEGASSASHLDHALLESLFYNEMVMLENSTAGQEAASSLDSPPCLPTEHDTPHTILEKEILRDFGVGGGRTLFPPTTASPAMDASAAPGVVATAAASPTQYGSHTSPSYTTSNHAVASSYSDAMLPPTVSQDQPHQKPTTNPIHHHHHPLLGHPQAPDVSAAMPRYENTPVNQAYNVQSGAVVNNGSSTGNLVVAGQQQQQSQLGGIVCADPQATATAAAAAAAMFSQPGGKNNRNNNSNGGNRTSGIKRQSSAIPMMSAPNNGVTAAAPHPSSAPAIVSSSNAPIANGAGGQQSLQATHADSPSSGSSPLQVPQDRARQLVDQFATLASRLGIDLPDSVLQSLTSAAAKNDPTLLLNTQQQQQQKRQQDHQQQYQQQQTKGTKFATPARSTAALVGKGTTAATSNSVINSFKTKQKPAVSTGDTIRDETSCVSTELTAMAPTVIELRKTAEEAIAAVTQSNKDPASATENQSRAGSNSLNSSSNTGTEHKPTYSKRRKKPRLSDCEAKLAQLKAENEQLKRHLQNVSNKAHKFDMEKEMASKQIAQLMYDPNASPRDMGVAVRKFSDMYSDYGVNRQQELSFHLEQLQRLVNPTNFTKMGLWTLGHTNQGTKKNPIAGILVKELDITPQQGRKILDQSEKIRQLCENLKEAHSLLVKLKHLCEKKTRTFQDHMNKCTEILTSKQVVKLIIWINGHTQLLDSVCPGWGTEHIHSK